MPLKNDILKWKMNQKHSLFFKLKIDFEQFYAFFEDLP